MFWHSLWSTICEHILKLNLNIECGNGISKCWFVSLCVNFTITNTDKYKVCQFIWFIYFTDKFVESTKCIQCGGWYMKREIERECTNFDSIVSHQIGWDVHVHDIHVSNGCTSIRDAWMQRALCNKIKRYAFVTFILVEWIQWVVNLVNWNTRRLIHITPCTVCMQHKYTSKQSSETFEKSWLISIFHAELSNNTSN